MVLGGHCHTLPPTSTYLLQSAQRGLWNAVEDSHVHIQLSTQASLLLCLRWLERGGQGLLQPARTSNSGGHQGELDRFGLLGHCGGERGDS